MTLTNNLRTQVDLPIYEWCRFAPVASAAGTVMCTSDGLNGRYIYYNLAAGSNFWRYDTWSDCWEQLASPPTTPTSPCSMIYNAYHGYTGKVISATSSTIQIAGLYGNILGNTFSGNSLTANTVRIIAGKGAGQSATVSSVADVVVADNGVPTTVSAVALTDSTKAWTVNQWAGYQMRITYGTGVQQIRKILYNTATVLTFADPNAMAYDTQANNVLATALSTTAGAQSLYAIESSVLTQTSTWGTNPDNTSKFLILTGGIWLMHGQGTAYGIQYYDVAADIWYYKTNNSGMISAAVILATDVQMEQITESGGTFLSSTATSGGNFTLTDSTLTLTTNRYANFLIKITGGTGIGQTRTILAHSATVFTVVRVWDVNPDNTSTYTIYGDYDKIYMVGNASSSMYYYSVEADQLVTGRIYDWGVARGAACVLAGVNQLAIPISTITSATTTATATTAIAHNLITGQTVTITGDTSANSAKYNISAAITVTSTTTFTYTITSAGGVSASITGQSTTTLYDSTKNWPVNGLTGMIVSYTTGAAGATGVATNVQVQIASNTATQLTFAVSTTTVNGTTRYVIFDPKSFGTDVTQGAQTQATNGYGTASSGSATTLVDSSKAWATNQWSATTHRRVQIIAGTGAGALLAITSNTATTLTYASQSFSADTTTQYRILDSFGYCTATGATTTLTDGNQNWVTNCWAGQRLKFTSGSGVGQESAIQSNTATVLTFTAVTTAPTATTTYSILQPSITGAGNCIGWAWGTSDSATKGNYLLTIRGGATALLARYDITTERWKLLSTYPFFETYGSGTMMSYDGGNRFYFHNSITNRLKYYDIVNNKIQPSSSLPYAVGTAQVGNRMELVQTTDGLQYIYWQRHANLEWYRVLVLW